MSIARWEDSMHVNMVSDSMVFHLRCERVVLLAT
jgi:hypothetical protein